MTFLQAGDGCVDEAELMLASHECAFFGPLDVVAHTDEPPGENGLRLPLERQLSDRLELEFAFDQTHRRLAHIRLTGRRCRLEPLSEDDRVAEHCVVHAGLAAQDACDSMAGVDAHMECELGVMRQVANEPRQLCVHLECHS